MPYIPRPQTDEELIEHFDGFMIPINDWDVGDYQVPGWKCKHCGWIIGTSGYPPGHNCPEEGIELQKRIAERLDNKASEG